MTSLPGRGGAQLHRFQRRVVKQMLYYCCRRKGRCCWVYNVYICVQSGQRVEGGSGSPTASIFVYILHPTNLFGGYNCHSIHIWDTEPPISKKRIPPGLQYNYTVSVAILLLKKGRQKQKCFAINFFINFAPAG